MQVLEDQEYRLPSAFAEDEAREGLERVLASLARLELRPSRALDRHAEKRFEGRRRRPRILAELGQPVDHTVCLRRAAVETALADVEVTVPVRRRLELFYPLHPTAAIEDGAKRITFEPPAETLRGERIHQWLGAAWGTRGRDWDLFRIARQQILVRRLLETGVPFGRFLAHPELVAVSDRRALEELACVRPDWRFAILDDVRGARIDGKEVLLRGRPRLVARGWLWLRWHTRALRRRRPPPRSGPGVAGAPRPAP